MLTIRANGRGEIFVRMNLRCIKEAPTFKKGDVIECYIQRFRG